MSVRAGLNRDVCEEMRPTPVVGIRHAHHEVAGIFCGSPLASLARDRRLHLLVRVVENPSLPALPGCARQHSVTSGKPRRCSCWKRGWWVTRTPVSRSMSFVRVQVDTVHGDLSAQDAEALERSTTRLPYLRRLSS